MPTIYLVRHGETTAFKKSILAGASDVPLSRAGLDQMQDVRKFLENKPLSMVYASPLRRAAEPAGELAAALKIPYSEVMDLSEIDFGDWEGKCLDDLARQQPIVVAQAKNAGLLFGFPNGERIDYFRRRVQTALAQILRSASGEIAIYTHSGTLRVLYSATASVPLSEAFALNVPGGAVVAVEMNGGKLAVPKGIEVGHLREAPQASTCWLLS